MELQFPAIADWSAAYDNRAAVPGLNAWVQDWTAASQALRAAHAGEVEIDLAYGAHPRERLDVFHPTGAARGTQVFVHGGYWRMGEKSAYWALAGPLLAAGWRVAFITYPLCPEVTIGRITQSVQHAVEHLAARLPDGPLVLSGHSAGGHLVTWLVSQGSTLAGPLRARIRKVVSFSGVHDLRAMRRSDELNRDLHLSEADAARWSPVLSTPGHAFDLVCACGADELPELRRLNVLLANAWSGLGVASSRAIEIDAAHHFTVLDGLRQPDSALTRSLLG